MEIYQCKKTRISRVTDVPGYFHCSLKFDRSLNPGDHAKEKNYSVHRIISAANNDEKFAGCIIRQEAIQR